MGHPSPPRNHRTAHLEVCCGGNDIQDGGQDAAREKHRQISHGLAGIQRVRVKTTPQNTGGPCLKYSRAG